MARSIASDLAPIQNLSGEDIAPLESVVTDEGLDSNPYASSGWLYLENLTRQPFLYGRLPDPFIEERKIEQDAVPESQRAVLRRLKAWYQWDIDRYQSLGQFLMSKAGVPKRPICPSRAELLSLAAYFFSRRQSLKVVVCNFSEGRFKRFEANFTNVGEYKPPSYSVYDVVKLTVCKDWETKPLWATVRWMSVYRPECI